MRADAAHASTVGFAVFDRDGDQWRPVALRRLHQGSFSTDTAGAEVGVAMAVACWGPGAPAYGTDGTHPLRDFWSRSSVGPTTIRRAAVTSSAGARATCSLGAYGVAKGDVPVNGNDQAEAGASEDGDSSGDADSGAVVTQATTDSPDPTGETNAPTPDPSPVGGSSEDGGAGQGAAANPSPDGEQKITTGPEEQVGIPKHEP